MAFMCPSIPRTQQAGVKMRLLCQIYGRVATSAVQSRTTLDIRAAGRGRPPRAARRPAS